MTNSRLTDPEVLEWRFPVRLESYAIRRGSGGAGRHRGGDGGDAARPLPRADDGRDAREPPPRRAVRRRRAARPAQLGRNWVERADGTREEFGATCRVEMAAGDVFVIETPGGGGFGTP